MVAGDAVVPIKMFELLLDGAEVLVPAIKERIHLPVKPWLERLVERIVDLDGLHGNCILEHLRQLLHGAEDELAMLREDLDVPAPGGLPVGVIGEQHAALGLAGTGENRAGWVPVDPALAEALQAGGAAAQVDEMV